MKKDERIIANPKSCFLNLSYTSGQTPSKIELIIKEYFEKRGFEVKTGRMIPAGEKTDPGILNLIKSCVFGIVVYNEPRHNISYEWGIMDGFGMYAIPFMNKNIHMDIDKDFSDKKGTSFIFYSGDSDEKDIITELENSRSLKAAMEKVEEITAKKISSEESEKVREAARLLTESNVPLGTTVKIRREISDTSAVSASLSSLPKLTAEGHFYLANTYYNAGDLENAEEEYRKSIRMNPNYLEAYHNLIILLSDLGRDDEAEKEYREITRIYPEFVEAHIILGNLLSKLKKYDEAEKEYRETIKLNPNYTIAHINLLELYVLTKNYEKAFETEKNALKLVKEDQDIIYIHFLKICSYALQNKKKEMNLEIDNLLKILKTMKEWDLEYDFLEIKTVLESLDKDTKSLIFSLIDLLENKITLKDFSRK